MNTLLSPQTATRTSVADTYGLNSQKAAQTSSDALDSSVTSGSKTSVATVNREGRQSTQADTAKAPSSDEIALSPRAQRAQKIQAMAQDFFVGKQFSVDNIPALVSRLQTDGILSEAQLARLSPSALEQKPQSNEMASLQAFVDNELSLLSKNMPNNALITTLFDAKTVLANMDDAQSPLLAQKANKVVGQLTDFLNSEPSLTDTQKQQYQGLKTTMQLASSMGAHQSASGQLSSYLALAKR